MAIYGERGYQLSYDIEMKEKHGWQTIKPAWVLIFLIILGFVLGAVGDFYSVCKPSLGFCLTVTNLLAQQNGMIFYLHTYWQFFTSIFVTDSILDAAFNAMAVYILNIFVDSAINKTRYFAIFFLTALFGNVLTLLWGAQYASAGASGGIFGIFAASIAFSWAENKKFDGGTFAVFLAVFVVSSFLPNVNWLAHLGGALAGFAAGPLLYQTLKNKIYDYASLARSSRFSEVTVGVLIALITIGSIVQFIFFVAV